MFFLIAKLFLLAAVVLLIVLTRGTRWEPYRRWLLWLLVLLGTNPALPNELLRWWELPPKRLSQLPRQADAAVLLTGISDIHEPTDRVYLERGADRFTNALWLYRAGRVRQIIISGGSGSEHKTARTEADELRILLRLAGVPATAILTEEKSRNTHENALYTKQLLASYPEMDTLVLVTSAFHQRRALGCFHKVGLNPIPFPADYRTTPRRASLDYWLLPSVKALVTWGTLLHELAGWTVYKLLGYA